MASIALFESQRTMLQTLVDLYRDADDERAIMATQIAAVLQRHLGTIHNQMQNLKSLHLVKSLSGPHGGYKPTSATYHARYPAPRPRRRDPSRLRWGNTT